MALTGPDHWQPEQGSVMVTAVGHGCFFCCEPIESDPAWVWSGASGEIFLHPPCAADLGIRLFADLHAWQRKSGSRFRATP
jgi:hypothetical protein